MALRRILTDPNAYSNATLNQTFVTTLLSFDPDTQLFSLSENLVIPPKVTNEPGKSRIWNDFTFQEIGKGDDFVTMETIVEKDPANPQTMAPGIAPPHPYLSVEKATRVNQWVVERAEMDNDDEPEPEPDSSAPPQPDTLRETPPPPPLAPSIKKPPGIRTRKAISTAKPQAAPVPEQPAPEPAKASSPPPDPKKGTQPRKRWIMQYESGPEDRQINLLEDANTNANSRSSSGTSAPVKTPDSPHGSSTTARPQTPEGEPRLSINFDPTKYGLNKSPQHAAKSSFGSSTSPANGGESLLLTPKRRPTKPSDLIDLLAPATPGSAVPHPLMSFDQPALVPQKSGGNDSPSAENAPSQELVLLNTGNSSQDLLGLDFEDPVPTVSDSIMDAGIGPGLGSALIPFDQDQNQNQNQKGDSLSWQEQEKRLLDLKKSLREKKKGMSSIGDDDDNDNDSDTTRTFPRPPKDQRQISMMLARQRLAELEKHHETVKKSSDETSTREFHRTMNHKAARPSEKKAKSKAEAKAKRQATLEDAWGIVKPVKKPPVEKSEDADDSMDKNTTASEAKKNGRRAQLLKTEAEAHQKSLKSVFEALKPALDAAEYFTGPLTLEIQLGLILIPLLPKTYDEGLISLSEWTKIFQPRNSLPAPTTKFINRLTTTGSDVDHIVDLKTSKADGKRHLFEQEYTEYNVSYEFHCRTTADKPFLIAVDEQGRHSIRKPATALGAVNLHFPRQTWDASAVLGGIVEHIVGSDPELEEAVQHLVDNLWVQPDKSLVRIFSRLPKGNKFVIEKVFMKRWTRHRHIRPDSTTPAPAAPAAAAAARNPSPENAPSPSPPPFPDTEQDIFLQITEVQDLLIGSSTSDSQALRARCAPLPEMHKKDRQWYEVSLVSPAIEAILKANANVEIGERTDDWRSTDLLGKDALLFSENPVPELGGSGGDGDGSASMALSPPLSPVATAIGKAGLGELLQLTKTVVEKIDGIGFFNYGPGVEAVRAASGGGGGFAGFPGGATATGAGTANLNLNTNPNPMAMAMATTPFTGKQPLPPPPGLPLPLPPAQSSALVPKIDQLYQQQQGRLFDDLEGLDMSQVGSGPAPAPATGVGTGPGTGPGLLPLMERPFSTSSARFVQQAQAQQVQQQQQQQQTQQKKQDELDYW